MNRLYWLLTTILGLMIIACASTPTETSSTDTQREGSAQHRSDSRGVEHDRSKL